MPRTRRSTRLPAATHAASRLDIEALRPTPSVTAAPASRRRPAARPTRRPEKAVTAGPEHRQQEDTVELVRRLARRVHTLYGVPETADVVIADAVERTNADAGALLVPDDDSWRVAAGVGLRPLERRYELHADSWLVQEIALAHKGAIIEESDIAREQLQGAPLASWRHLLVAPVPQVHSLLVLARREDPAFDEDDLARLATLGAEAGPLLAAAIDTLSLARGMSEFRDDLDLPR